MGHEVIQYWLVQRPFKPFEVRLSSGVTYEVRQPENAVLTTNRLVVVYPENDQVALFELHEIASIEPFAPQPRANTLRERLLKLAGTVDDLPADMARNHDHYLHGAPRR